MLALLDQVPRSGWKEEQEHDKKESTRCPLALLVDVTTQCKGLRGQQKMELLTVVAGFNARGEKVTKTGSSSLYELRAQDWPDSIRTLARDKLAELVDLLIAEGELQSSPKEGLQVAGK